MAKQKSVDLFAHHAKMLTQSSVYTSQQIAGCLRNAEALLAEEMKAKHLKMMKSAIDFMAKYGDTEWWATAMKMYKIENRETGFVVVSLARDWQGPKEWEYSYEFEAQQQIQKLVGYKDRDRKLGFGDREADALRVETLAKRELEVA